MTEYSKYNWFSVSPSRTAVTGPIQSTNQTAQKVTIVINPAIGCHYFPSGQLPSFSIRASPPLAGTNLQFILLGE